MKYTLLAAFAALPFLGSSAAPDSAGWDAVKAFSCGNENYPDNPILRDARAQAGSNSTHANAAITIQTYIHLVSTALNTISITPDQVTRQFNFLNQRYQPSGISFNLVNISRDIHEDWARNINADVMMRSLRKGAYDALNIYIQTDRPVGAFGECSLPALLGPVTPYPKALTDPDGCRIAAQTLPGGVAFPYNGGTVLVHEVGHWFGLLHPFQGNNCFEDGDGISDTPFQATDSSGPDIFEPPNLCPILFKDTCPDDPGQDNYHNYMDYAPNVCQTLFTPVQQSVMNTIFNQFRRGL